MKANQKFLLAEEEAVSPVIAVILMVAITVVLAATVFVLVNDLGKNVGQTGPSLGLVSDSAQSSTSAWVAKVSSATKLASLGDYRFVLSTPSNGTIVATPAPAGGTFTTGYLMRAVWADTTGDALRKDAAEFAAPAAVGAGNTGFVLQWTDIDGNAKYSVGDTLTMQYGTDGTLGRTFPAGEYTLEILHTPSGSSSASLPRTF